MAPYSEPEVEGRRVEPKRAVAPDPAPREQESAPVGGAERAEDETVLGGAAAAVPAADEVDPEPTRAPSADGEIAPPAKAGGVPLPLLLGGAAILIVIVLLLVRRR